MEIELKYAIPDEDLIDMIWNDDALEQMADPDTYTQDHFYGIYYDTPDKDLTKNDITMRIRMEGDIAVATLKWNGKTDGALHRREELNVTTGDVIPAKPDIGIFAESDIGARIADLVGDKKLEQLMTVDVLRRQVRVETTDSILEVSIDNGQISTFNGDLPIMELEIELFRGDEEDLLELGEEMRGKYSLIPENDSKFARGLKLIGGL